MQPQRLPFDANRIRVSGGILDSGTSIVPLEINANGGLDVNIVGGGGSGGTASAFGSAFPAVGTAIGAISSTGTMVGLNLDSSGNLLVSGGGGGTQYTDGATPPTHPIGPTLIYDNSGTWAHVSVANPLPVTASVTISGVATSANQTNASQKTQIVDGSGNIIASTSNALNTSITNSSIAVTGTFFQATQPISATSLPLPTGASTSALQTTGNSSLSSIATSTANIPALGQALAAASVPVVLTAAQITTLTPPAAITNYAQETGGNLATIAGAVSSSIVQANVKQINGIVPLMGNGTTGTGSQRVTIASDNTAFAVNATLQTGSNAIGSITNTSFAATQGTAANLNATVIGTGTFAVQATQSGSWTSTVTQGTGTNLHTVLDSGTLTSITNTVVTDDLAASATGSGVPANAMYAGLLAQTANPSAASAGNLVGALSDKLGKQVVVGSIRDLKLNQITTITGSTAETTVLTQVASTFLDVYGVIAVNSSVTATNVAFKDSTSGTTQFNIYVPAGETRGFMLPESAAIKQTTVNTNWTATSSASITSLVITMLAVKNI